VKDLVTVQEWSCLAREIHDSLSHHLTAIDVHLEAARTQLGGQAPPVSDVALADPLTVLAACNGLHGVDQSA